jgi:hypothetical protein
MVPVSHRVIWQQIGNNIARATATRLQCDEVLHHRKWFGISSFATSTQCHTDATVNKGIQVRILVPQFVNTYLEMTYENRHFFSGNISMVTLGCHCSSRRFPVAAQVARPILLLVAFTAMALRAPNNS